VSPAKTSPWPTRQRESRDHRAALPLTGERELMDHASKRADDPHELELLTEQVRRHPTLLGFGKLVWQTVSRPLREPIGLLLAAVLVGLALWGGSGAVPLLSYAFDGWRPFQDPTGRPEVLPGIPWDQEWIAYAIGVVLLVLVPCALIRWRFKHDLRDYGLGLPEQRSVRLSLFTAVVLAVASLPLFVLSAGDESMQATYPLYRGPLEGLDFVVYELGYLSFFLVIEFVFRGLLLLGLVNVRERNAPPDRAQERGGLPIGFYAIFVAGAVYTAWHLSKPTPELLGTLVWGPVAGAVVLATRSIWPVVVVHWLLNVVLDRLLLG
jgi:membrane protease YdiL (CAAX protease family)